ncbi:MAG TPA: hypothetical protein VNB94_09970 [Mycobacteriales bacterium]|nr:hypothetical protein [Mycobacteriales bacterium]
MLPDFERRGRDGPLLPGKDPSPFWTFYDEVARHQLHEWLPHRRSRILDLSRGPGRHSANMAAEGHDVIRLVDDPRKSTLIAEPARPDVSPVIAESFPTRWIADGCVDGVVAESGALSAHLAAEDVLLSIRRMLAPGGRLLLCVDSLGLGLSRLAEQSRWAELADVPSADVVLIPHEDGSITRCFWPEELADDLDDSGFAVEWIRPRTVLSREAVERALREDASSLASLVDAEVALSREREGESIGIHLVASARRRG